LDRESFPSNELEELAAKLAPQIPWRQIHDLGNQLRHAYDSINVDTLWEIVTGDLGPLDEACKDAMGKLPPDVD
jgi:uncharacterized protein with HEPN domain